MSKQLQELGGVSSRYCADELVDPLGRGGQDEVLDLLGTGSLGERLQDHPRDWLGMVRQVVQLVHLVGVAGGLRKHYYVKDFKSLRLHDHCLELVCLFVKPFKREN